LKLCRRFIGRHTQHTKAMKLGADLALETPTTIRRPESLWPALAELEWDPPAENGTVGTERRSHLQDCSQPVPPQSVQTVCRKDWAAGPLAGSTRHTSSGLPPVGVCAAAIGGNDRYSLFILDA